MDRPESGVRASGLCLIAAGLLLANGGCRSTRSEVPPGKPYQTTGTPPTIGFSNEPHPGAAMGMAGLSTNTGPGDQTPDGRGSLNANSNMVYGTPPQSTRLGAPTENRFGPPGTAGMSGAGTAGSSAIADSLMRSAPTTSQMLARDPETVPASGSGTSSPAGPIR